jgi:hypothetical protein
MSQRAFLLIADIGGYTKFMKIHRINLAHAQHIVAQLLEAVIDGAGNLKLAKLEGDAAFFYGELTNDADVDKYARRVSDIRRSFLTRRQELTIDRWCTCDGCVQAEQLKLKFVAHEGEIAFQRVKRNTELAGIDVIFVHRLLKNSVPASEYVLMSEPVHTHVDPQIKGEAKEIEHELEGFGKSRQFWVDLVASAEKLPPPPHPTAMRKFLAWAKMTWRSIPYVLGLKKACDGFRNGEGLGILPPPLETTPSILPPGMSMAPPVHSAPKEVSHDPGKLD